MDPLDEKEQKKQLYHKLIDAADEQLVLERMQELGFWPEDQPAPEESAEARKERERLRDELERLHNQGVKAKDPEAALAKERVRRWQESKKRRALLRVEREQAKEERRAAWQARRAADLVHAGEGISGGLAADAGQPERLAAAGLPRLDSAPQIAEAMGVSLSQLRWLTFHRRSVTLVHYHRYQIPKKTGGQRQISAPKPLLANCQRFVLERILDKCELSSQAHGFVAGRSIVSNASQHAGRDVVVNMDLRDFFPSLGFRRVKGLFGAFGYGEATATVLALLCTEPPRVPAELDGKLHHVALGERVLPQGACTSPAITNLICRRLDRRLAGLARHFGAAYTRYADDLTFSGDSALDLTGLLGATRRILRDEGFAEHPDKTRVMRRGSRQEVTGLVVNQRPALSRKQRKLLRAMLHNAGKRGLAAENRAGHPRFADYLRGHTAFAQLVDPERREQWALALARALSGG